jgi:hypothetical protein
MPACGKPWRAAEGRGHKAKTVKGQARPPGASHSEQQGRPPNERPHGRGQWPIAQGPSRQRRIDVWSGKHPHPRRRQGRPRQQAQPAVAIARLIVWRLACMGGRTHAEPTALTQVLRQRGSRRQQRRPQGQHTQDGGQRLAAGEKSEGLKHREILEECLTTPPRPAHSEKTAAARRCEKPQWPPAQPGR